MNIVLIKDGKVIGWGGSVGMIYFFLFGELNCKLKTKKMFTASCASVTKQNAAQRSFVTLARSVNERLAAEDKAAKKGDPDSMTFSEGEGTATKIEVTKDGHVTYRSRTG